MSIIRTRSQEQLEQQAAEAARLEAEQERAQAEEEISTRLPTEVLNISRRLDLQQDAVERLQTDMTNLMAMVSQIGTSIDKQQEQPSSPRDPTPTTTVPLSTPSAGHYQPTLSPVPEGSTLMTSPAASATPSSARPLQFGNPPYPSPSPASGSASAPAPPPPPHPPHPHPNCFTQTLYPHSAPPPTTYPPYQELSMDFTAIILNQGACVSTIPTWHQQLQVQHIGVAELAPPLFDATPTENIQSCAIQGATVVQNCEAHHSALAMECQKVPSVCATSNEEDCLTKSEQQLYEEDRPENEQTSKCLGKASENETHSSHSPMSASATDQMRFQTFERMPVFDIYDDETEDCSNVFVAVPASPPEQQPSEEEQEEGEKLHKCFSKALETEETNACLSYISAVCDCTLEQQQHNGEMASVNVQQLRAPRLNLLEIDESIGVFASNPRQQPYVAGQQADVQDFLIQLQPQDDERALNCPVFQASDSIVTSSNQASIEHSMKALVWLQSPLFSHLHNQLQRSNTFSVWDPGILNQLDMMLDKIALVHLVHHILTCELFSFIRQPADLKPFWTQFPFQYYSWYNATNALLEGLYVHMIQIVDCMGSARLPPTQISTHASSNTELAVLASRYYSLHLHQITNWTSTTSNGTTSAEYAYTLDFIIDQWELHKQGVQKSYSAMSSPNYLQIVEMNILFITFLPP